MQTDRAGKQELQAEKESIQASSLPSTNATSEVLAKSKLPLIPSKFEDALINSCQTVAGIKQGKFPHLRALIREADVFVADLVQSNEDIYKTIAKVAIDAETMPDEMQKHALNAIEELNVIAKGRTPYNGLPSHLAVSKLICRLLIHLSSDKDRSPSYARFLVERLCDPTSF